MIRDYTKEVGLPSPKKHLPRSIVGVVFAGVAVAVTFGVMSVLDHAKTHHSAEHPVASSAPAKH